MGLFPNEGTVCVFHLRSTPLDAFLRKVQKERLSSSKMKAVSPMLLAELISSLDAAHTRTNQRWTGEEGEKKRKERKGEEGLERKRNSELLTIFGI